jgi:Lamin Tail Domain
VKRAILVFAVMGAVFLVASGMALAATRVTIPIIHYDARGNDNLASNLNNEYVVFKNNTNTAIRMRGWKVHDEGRIHVYTFPTFRLGAGKTVTLHSGRGTNTSSHLYWQRSYGAVWNNTGDTVTLRNPLGKVVVSRSY